MKKTKRRALYIVAALLGALFVLSCLIGFAACGGGSGNPEEVPGSSEDDDTKKDDDQGGTTATVSTVSISGNASTMTVGGTATLTASVVMSDNSAYKGSYSWTSSDSTKVSVSGNGATATVKAEAEGNATITVSVSDSKSATYTIAVSAATETPTPTPEEPTVTSVSITGDAANMTVGDTATLTASVVMSDNNAYTGSYSWSSSDSTKVSVSGNGATATVKAEAEGNATITVSVSDSKSATYEISVSAVPTILGVTLSQTTLAFEYGESSGSSLTATVTMSDGSDYEGDYEWTSSDDEEKVVKVSGSGASVTVTGVKCGTATITVSVGEDDNVKTATCTVTVSEDHAAAEAGRITGSADVADEDFHFMFDETYDEDTTVVFDDSSVSAEYDAENKTYTLSGMGIAMTEEQAGAFYNAAKASSHIGHEYVGFIVNVNEGETIDVTTYTGSADETKEKDFTFTSPADDTSFLVDIEDHNTDGDWKMVLDVTYAGGDEETYTVVIGDIEKGVADETNLISVFDNGGDVTLTQDITLTDTGLTDTGGVNHDKMEAQAGGSGRVQSPLKVASGVEVTLDLNGHKLVRNGADTGGYIFCTILVMAGGTLTVVDSSEDGSGVVDVTGHGNECLYNYGGTVTLEGGFFTRSKENGMSESSNGSGTSGGAESSYTIQNYGDLTIDGATVFNAGDYSTCVRSQGIDANNSASLTMISGKVYGGKYAVGSGSSSSDIHATFTMTGGTLGGKRSDTDALPYRALNNYDEATVTGGTLLGGNGGAIDVGGKADACVEGVVIFNEDGGTGDTLTIGDGKGNGPEIIYEGINPNAAVAGDNQPEETRMSYYDEAAGSEIPAFATGIAAYSGEVDINAGTIECSDKSADRDYNFMGVYLTNGTLNVSGGSISGDEAILIDCTAETSPTIAISITGGELVGNIVVYTKDEDGEVVSSVYTPGSVIVPSEEFEFNEGTFDGLSGLDEDFTVTDEDDEEITYTAGDITVTVTVESDGSITYVVDGIVANMMSEDQKVAFDAKYAQDEDGTIRFYIAVQVAVQPGETVIVTGGGKSETVDNTTGTEVIYDLWVIEIGQSHFSDVTEVPTDAYVVVDISSFSMSVTVKDSDGNETGGYTVTFGSIFLPQQAWKCASDEHTVSSWTVVVEETCGTKGLMVGTCDYCGKTVYEVVEATGNHDWDDGEVTTAPTCTEDGVLTKTCTVCGETTTEAIPATGHTATTYSDGNMYAVYKNTAAEDAEAVYAWCALCEVCNVWFEIGDEDIYNFVLVTTDEASLDAAIAVAKAREDGSADDRTQILVYGEITISDSTYVTIDCDNVEIYGLSDGSSKIIDSAYETSEHSNTAADGVEITGKNVTIRDLTIDGSKLDENSTHVQYEHGLEILGSAENVTISNCVITGGTSSNSSAVVLMNGSETGYLLIDNCTLSGYHGLTIEHDGQDLNVTISGGTIDGSYYGILIDAGSGVYLNVEDAKINGKNSLTTNTTSAIFTNCTFGFGVYNGAAYGSMNTYCDVTLTGCTFLSNNTGYENTSDTLVYTSSNYVIQARVEGVTISLIDCKFENTYADLGTDTLAVTAENFVYLVGGKSSVTNCYLYFGDPETSLQYVYDATNHTVEHNHDIGDWDEGEVTLDPTCTEVGEKTYTCGVCGATKTTAIPALGHTATEQSAGNMYAVYSEESEAWYTQCDRCGKWVVEIDDGDIYNFVLVAQDEASLDAAIEIAGKRNGSEDEITQILVYGEIKISDTSYVLIDCDNVEIYGLGADKSKIIDSAYEGSHSGTVQDGVEISGSNVTIRNLTIDGTALNSLEGNDSKDYKHAVQIRENASNVTISNCVITGGGANTNDSSVCIFSGSGTVKIVDCILSGAASGLVIEYGGQGIDIEVSGGKIDAIRPIWIDGGDHVTLNVENAEILGRSELGPGAAITFTDCTFGYHIEENIAYGSVDVYGVITFKNCKFLSHEEGEWTDKDSILKESNNYVIGAYYDNVTIYLIDCTFENTNSELVVEGAEDSMVAVNKDTFIYIVAGGSGVYGCSLYFDDPEEGAAQYIYDVTTNTVTAYVEEEPGD